MADSSESPFLSGFGLGGLKVVVAGIALLVGQVLKREGAGAKLADRDGEVVKLGRLTIGDNLAPAATVLQEQLIWPSPFVMASCAWCATACQ